MFFVIPDLFTPYIEGRERAIDRNWNDLNQYNTVQKNQLGNLFDLATFSPRVNQEYEKLTESAFKNRQAARTDQLNQNMFPGLAAEALARGELLRQNPFFRPYQDLFSIYLNNASAAAANARAEREANDPINDYVRRLVLGALPGQNANAGTEAQAQGTGTGTQGTNAMPPAPSPADRNAPNAGTPAPNTGQPTTGQEPSVTQQQQQQQQQ